MAPAFVEAVNMLDYGNDLKARPTNPRVEEVDGTDGFNTTRQVVLYTTLENHPHTVYFHVTNHTNHASVRLDLEKKPENMPEIYATLDETPIDLTQITEYFNDVKILDGQIFRIWLGGQTFDERDLNCGSAIVIWEKPDEDVSA